MPSKTHYPPAPGFVSFTVDGFIVDANDLTAAPSATPEPSRVLRAFLKSNLPGRLPGVSTFQRSAEGGLKSARNFSSAICSRRCESPTPWSASIWAERDLERERLKRQAQQPGYKLVPIEENQPSNPFIPKHRGISSLKDPNTPRMVFLGPHAQDLYHHWEAVARMAVAAFRADVARAGAMADVAAMVDELSPFSPAFKAMWQGQRCVGQRSRSERPTASGSWNDQLRSLYFRAWTPRQAGYSFPLVLERRLHAPTAPLCGWSAYDQGMSVSVKLQTVLPRKLAAVRRKVAPGAVGSAWKPALDKVWEFIRSQPGLWTTGHNIFLYHHPLQPGAPILCDFAVEVTRIFETAGEVYATETPGGEAAIAVHLGPYHRMNQVHDAIRNWMATNRRESAGQSWEIYGDPTPDQANTETTVVYLLK